MEVKNNPAGRLLDILRNARQQNPKETARKAWATVFTIDQGDTGALLKMLAEMIDLVHETKAQIQRVDNIDHQLHLKPFSKIDKFLSQINLDANWEHWQAQLDEATLMGIEFGADKLSRISGYTQIAHDELPKLQKQIDELVSAIAVADLPSSVKLLLLRNLEAIRFALLAYRIRGLEGLEEEIERSVGSLLLHRNEIGALKDRPNERKMVEGFFTVVDRLNKVVALGRNTKELAAPALTAITQLFN